MPINANLLELTCCDVKNANNYDRPRLGKMKQFKSNL